MIARTSEYQGAESCELATSRMFSDRGKLERFTYVPTWLTQKRPTISALALSSFRRQNWGPWIEGPNFPYQRSDGGGTKSWSQYHISHQWGLEDPSRYQGLQFQSSYALGYELWVKTSEVQKLCKNSYEPGIMMKFLLEKPTVSRKWNNLVESRRTLSISSSVDIKLTRE